MNANIQLALSIPELNLVLESLGQQPYFKVYDLINKLQTQAQEQLNSATHAAATNGAESTAAVKNGNGILAATT